MLYGAANTITQRLPKTVSPKTHAIADYVVVGIFAVAAGLFWKANRRASVAALFCGGASLALNLATDYPGGVVKMVTFPTHGKIDLGIAGLTAAMPEVAGFRRGRRFFLLQSGAMTMTKNLTRFTDPAYSRRTAPKLY